MLYLYDKLLMQLTEHILRLKMNGRADKTNSNPFPDEQKHQRKMCIWWKWPQKSTWSSGKNCIQTHIRKNNSVLSKVSILFLYPLLNSVFSEYWNIVHLFVHAQKIVAASNCTQIHIRMGIRICMITIRFCSRVHCFLLENCNVMSVAEFVFNNIADLFSI